MLLIGVLLLVASGLCWVIVGAVVSRAAKRNLDIDSIQMSSAAAVAFAALILCPLSTLFQKDASFPAWDKTLFSALPMIFAGCGNFVTIHLMKCGMTEGSSGAVWGITQSAVICPFLMGMIFFHVPVTGMRIAGIVLILTGIACFAHSKPTENGKMSNFRWLIPTFAAFLVTGLSQCMVNMVSYWEENPLSGMARAGFVQFGTSFAAIFLFRPFTNRKPKTAGTFVPAVLTGLAQMFSLFFMFYQGLDMLAKSGCGAVGYPIAQGTCIAGMLLYSIIFLKEPLTFRTAAALVAVCGGVFAISM